eukprot:TRINITY_DN3542_c0_g1_i11.p1 TRINITY_DN3542_c0_g1~~TRINITY_DN3542_c0_g1_i11.p1  ORF type:complete len:236 (+),score=9.42 TRINITY_DN3542_c0_g1_i11:321-1028(+)
MEPFQSPLQPYNKEKLTPQQCLAKMKQCKQKESAWWWKYFEPIIGVDEEGFEFAYIQCTYCEEKLKPSNPSTRAQNHLSSCKKRKNFDEKNFCQQKRQCSEIQGLDRFIVDNKRKENVIKDVSLFFFKNNIALRLIQDPSLISAFKLLGVKLPGVKALSNSLLDQAYGNVKQQNEELLQENKFQFQLSTQVMCAQVLIRMYIFQQILYKFISISFKQKLELDFMNQVRIDLNLQP